MNAVIKSLLAQSYLRSKKTNPIGLQWTRNKLVRRTQKQVSNAKYRRFTEDMAQSAQESSKNSGTTFFSSIDVEYAYSQLKQDEITKAKCYFSIIGCQARGIYLYQTGFYGVTDLPAEFEKAIDLTLNNKKDKFAILDDFLILSHNLKQNYTQSRQRKLGSINR